MTLKNHDPSNHARWRIRTRFIRFHPNLKSMLFTNQIKASITVNWPFRPYAAITK